MAVRWGMKIAWIINLDLLMDLWLALGPKASPAAFLAPHGPPGKGHNEGNENGMGVFQWNSGPQHPRRWGAVGYKKFSGGHMRMQGISQRRAASVALSMDAHQFLGLFSGPFSKALTGQRANVVSYDFDHRDAMDHDALINVAPGLPPVLSPLNSEHFGLFTTSEAVVNWGAAN